MRPLKVGLLPKSSAEIFHAAVTNRHGDRFAGEIAAQEMQRSRHVGPGGEPSEDAFLARQPPGDLSGLGVGDGEKTVDVLAPDELQIGPAITGALQQMRAAGLQATGQHLNTRWLDDKTFDVRVVFFESASTA